MQDSHVLILKPEPLDYFPLVFSGFKVQGLNVAQLSS